VLELATRTRRRPAALLASLAPSVARAVACCPTFSPSPVFPEPPRPPPLAAAEPRRRPPLRPNPGTPRPLGEHVVVLSRLPGRQRRLFAGVGRARAARPAKGRIALIAIVLGCFA
jgi:hypothetical protein